MKYFFLLFLCFVLTASCVNYQSKSASDLPGGFAHTVYFWLQNPEKTSDREAFEKSLIKFLDTSEFIMTKHVGVPAATAHREVVDVSYTYSLLLTFKSKADQDKY